MNKSNFEVKNRFVYDQIAGEYLQKHLDPAERFLLTKWRGRWHEVVMLDLGVGAGRTAHVFAAITQRYVGIDYSPKMIELCRTQFPEDSRVKFAVGDASDLSFLGDEKFDLILFSFNGIDYVGHEKRLQVLREVRSKLKGPDSLFLFSSHSLHTFPFSFRWTVKRRRPFRTLYCLARDLVFNLRLTISNFGVSSDEIKRLGWAVLNDGAHGFQLSTYYVMPEEQVRQIEAAGFDLVGTFNTVGEPVDFREHQPDGWLYYLCCAALKSW
jgi:SAM-dependent methyltransferase